MLFIYITRLASKEIFSPSNKIHREVDRAKDLSAPLYLLHTNKVKTKESVYSSGKTLRVPGGLGSQISRQSAQGCQLCAPAAFTPQEIFIYK